MFGLGDGVLCQDRHIVTNYTGQRAMRTYRHASIQSTCIQRRLRSSTVGDLKSQQLTARLVLSLMFPVSMVEL